MTPTIILLSALLVITLVTYIGVAMFVGLRWLDELRQLVLKSGMDVIQLYSASNQAKIDVDTQRAKLEYSQELGQLRINENRQKMLSQ